MGKLVWHILAVLMLVGVAACGRQSPEYKIGVSQCSGDYWRVKTNEEIKRELMLHDDVDVEIRSAESDNSRQIEDIRYFIDNGFDMIVVSPNESKALTPVIEEAYSKGIPVLTFDRRIDGDSFTAHMEVDNYELGRSVANYARSKVRPSVKAIEIQGPISASPARRRHEGFKDAMSDMENSEILASVYGNWDDGLSSRLIDSLLDVYPQANMIYAHTDHMAIGAARAAKNKGRADIAVMGIDGFPHIGIKAVKEGMLDATFLYPSEGHRLLRIALAILKGEHYDRMNMVAPLSPIDKTNADIILSQDSLLTNESVKINFLRDRLDEYWSLYRMQNALLVAVITIAVLLAGFLFLLWRSIIANKRHQKVLLQKNRQLEDEKRKQEELYDKLREATQAKLMFFTNVSHDLRTPLTLISGPVEQMAGVDYLEPRHKSLMKMAQKNVNILKRLINQILDFRKYENGKSDMHLAEADMRLLVEGWSEAFHGMAERRDISIFTHIPVEGDLCMCVDVEKMERVFFNLMSNAFKHTPDNGKIEVSLHKNGDSTVVLEVKDSGEGISKEDCQHIFERFFQADSENPQGSGIGLALTKAFVELHGGKIDVESEKGKGSRFIVTLPVRHCSNKAVEKESNISQADIEKELMPLRKENREFDSSKPLLLVVDDNRDIQRLIGNLLGDEYNLIYASDGMQGVRMAVKYVPDLIICDVMMPVMDGMECVRRIKDDVSTSHIPVLMLTACSLDEQRARGYESGVDGYLSKPFGNEVLAARCRNLLAGRKRIKELYAVPGMKDKSRQAPEAKTPSAHMLPNDVESDFYSKFADIVTERLSDSNLSVDEIAGKIGLSQSQLTRKIKALTNYTPVEIIRTMRLRRAKTLLNGTEKTVGEIAFEVGFSSLAYFSKCYKDAFGVSPSEIRGKA